MRRQKMLKKFNVEDEYFRWKDYMNWENKKTLQ